MQVGLPDISRLLAMLRWAGLTPMIELEDRDGLKPSVAGAAVPGMGAKPLVTAFVRKGLRIELLLLLVLVLAVWHKLAEGAQVVTLVFRLLVHDMVGGLEV